MVREAQDALTINRYDMDFRLVQDVTELEQFSGGFPREAPTAMFSVSTLVRP